MSPGDAVTVDLTTGPEAGTVLGRDEQYPSIWRVRLESGSVVRCTADELTVRRYLWRDFAFGFFCAAVFIVLVVVLGHS